MIGRILALAPSAHSCRLGDKRPYPGEIVPSQGDMGSPLPKHLVMVDQCVAMFAEQHRSRSPSWIVSERHSISGNHLARFAILTSGGTACAKRR